MQTEFSQTFSDLSNRKLWLMLNDGDNDLYRQRIKDELMKRQAFQGQQAFHKPH